MTTTRKVLGSALVVAALGGVAALGVFGLFSATTQNSGNEISSGTVALSDNDAGSAQFNITGAKPGSSWTRCVKVTYNGSLPADIHAYQVGGAGPLNNYVNVTLTQGSEPGAVFPECTGFTPDATNGNGVLYSGPVNSSPLSPPSGTYATGAPLVPYGQAAWNPGDSVTYQATITLDPSAPDSVQGASTGVWSIFWEARNH